VSQLIFDGMASLAPRRRRRSSMPVMISYTCEQCGRIREAKPSRAQRNRFCSQRCARVGNKESELKKPKSEQFKTLIKGYERQKEILSSKTRICLLCEKAFTPISINQRYCSNQCRFLKNRRVRLRRKNLKLQITKSEYKRLLAAQNGICAICGSSKGSKFQNNKFAVDHCHQTNRVRGLLCSPCNLAIGLMRDSPELLERAIKYLQKSIA
jgi:hypothetical protein